MGTFKARVFECAMEDPKYLPLLALLHPPPSRRLLPGLEHSIIIQMMENEYPRHLRAGVLPAVEIDPERVIHVISHILFRRYNSDSPPSPSEEGPNVGVVANPEAEGSGDAVAVDGPQPSICFLSTSFMDSDETFDDNHASPDGGCFPSTSADGLLQGSNQTPLVTPRGPLDEEQTPLRLNDVFDPAPSAQREGPHIFTPGVVDRSLPAERHVGLKPAPFWPTGMFVPAARWVLGLDRKAVLQTLQTDPRCLMLLPQVFPPCHLSHQVAQARSNVHIVASYVQCLERMYPAYTKRDILYHLRFAPLTILAFIPYITQHPYDVPSLLQKLGGVPPERVGESSGLPVQPGAFGGVGTITESNHGYYVTFDDSGFPSHPPSPAATNNPGRLDLPCLIESTAGSKTTQCNVDKTVYLPLIERERSIEAIALRLDHFMRTHFPKRGEAHEEGPEVSSPTSRPLSREPRELHHNLAADGDVATEFPSTDPEMDDGDTDANADEIHSTDDSMEEPGPFNPEPPTHAHEFGSNDGTYVAGSEGHIVDTFLSAGNIVAKFRQTDDSYEVYLKTSRLMVRGTAFGFLLGAASFLGLRALAFSPFGALVGSSLLAVAMLLVL